MSVPLTQALGVMRLLRAHESPLVIFLADSAGVSIDVNSIQVEPMSDGDMGSLRFAPFDPGRRLGSTPSGCEFRDTDGVLVSAELNLDQDGVPFEIDVWKVDSTPLQVWPSRQDIQPAAT